MQAVLLPKATAPQAVEEGLACAQATPWQPVASCSKDMNSFNPKGKTSMKTFLIISAIAACALSAPAVSAQERTAPAKPAMSMGMDTHMSQMQEKMKTMQAQMDNMRNTTDPKARQKLMQEHMQAMQENMKAMHSMGGPMMMGAQKGGGMMGGKKGSMKEGGMMQHHEMMEKRMDMMQMMMEQMLQHDQMSQPMPAK